MQNHLKVLMAQINPTVGALQTNATKIIQVIEEQQKNHDLLIFPELALTGYPPEDLLFRKEFHQQVMQFLQQIVQVTTDAYVLLGHPVKEGEFCYNALSVIHQGRILKEYRKQKLPNYEVFDEERYFVAGEQDPSILELKNYRIGICICEDIWQSGPVSDLLNKGIDVLVSMNASPFDFGKYCRREELNKTYALRGVSVVYVNQVSGQDELLFDGQSFAMDKTGKICVRSPAFAEDLRTVTIQGDDVLGDISPLLEENALIYKALVFGTRDYVEKNHFPGVLLGLSGGIDSALTLAIAVDALGAERVHAVMMPSRYSAQMSSEDALKQLHTMNVAHTTLSIEDIFNSVLTTLDPVFTGLAPDITEENIQARIRGLLLMAMSNKTGKMVLTTSNKSETAVGYATLYGDMAGGLAVLKDVLKTRVYALAKYRNSLSAVIPERVITRAPSAELRSNQTDQDSLPDYAVLDAILVAYMEDEMTPEQIIQQGFKPEVVQQIIKLIRRNEYKRRQAAPGIKISAIAFGKDWRYPITNGFS
ncbi:MAG: NAD+ synthase [Legionella sp.]|nr:MAG: NAD+ synthase [Legionella sp.]